MIAYGRYVNRIRVFGMDGDAADVACLSQPHVGPRLSRVGRFPDPEAAKRDAARGGVARSDPDDVGIGRCQGDVADRDHALLGQDGFECCPVVDRFPDAARRRGKVEGVGITLVYSYVEDATALAGRSEGPE